MSWFSPKCPRCGGSLQETGYCAPYPTHRCDGCIANATRERELLDLRKRVAALEASEATKP